MSWSTDRRTPYTVVGIRRLKCIRCGQPATQQWQICSDASRFRPMCDYCDILLNKLVLRFVRHPDVQGTIDRYTEKKLS